MVRRLAVMGTITSFLVVLLLAVPGCSRPPRMDASTDESAKASVEKMTAGMTEEQKKEFLADAAVLMAKDAADRFGTESKRRTTRTELYQPLHGLTVAEIHAKAEELRKKK